MPIVQLLFSAAPSAEEWVWIAEPLQAQGLFIRIKIVGAEVDLKSFSKADVDAVLWVRNYAENAGSFDEAVETLAVWAEGFKQIIFATTLTGSYTEDGLRTAAAYQRDLPNLQVLIADSIDGIEFYRFGQYVSVRSARREAKQIEAAEKQEVIQSKAAAFIGPAVDSLILKELHYRSLAVRWYSVGLLSLICGFAFSLFSVSNSLKVSPASGPVTYDISRFLDLTRIGLALAAVLVLGGFLAALTKFSFDLGKSYMNESLRVAERMHAINFGKFFLSAFGDEATKEEVREVFSSWNIDRVSSFAGLDSKNYDPRVVEAIVAAVSAIHPTKK